MRRRCGPARGVSLQIFAADAARANHRTIDSLRPAPDGQAAGRPAAEFGININPRLNRSIRDAAAPLIYGK